MFLKDVQIGKEVAEERIAHVQILHAEWPEILHGLEICRG
jgi:hypothetical protein